MRFTYQADGSAGRVLGVGRHRFLLLVLVLVLVLVAALLFGRRFRRGLDRLRCGRSVKTNLLFFFNFFFFSTLLDERSGEVGLSVWAAGVRLEKAAAAVRVAEAGATTRRSGGGPENGGCGCGSDAVGDANGEAHDEYDEWKRAANVHRIDAISKKVGSLYGGKSELCSVGRRGGERERRRRRWRGRRWQKQLELRAASRDATDVGRTARAGRGDEEWSGVAKRGERSEVDSRRDATSTSKSSRGKARRSGEGGGGRPPTRASSAGRARRPLLQPVPAVSASDERLGPSFSPKNT